MAILLLCCVSSGLPASWGAAAVSGRMTAPAARSTMTTTSGLVSESAAAANVRPKPPPVKTAAAMTAAKFLPAVAANDHDVAARTAPAAAWRPQRRPQLLPAMVAAASGEAAGARPHHLPSGPAPLDPAAAGPAARGWRRILWSSDSRICPRTARASAVMVLTARASAATLTHAVVKHSHLPLPRLPTAGADRRHPTIEVVHDSAGERTHTILPHDDDPRSAAVAVGGARAVGPPALVRTAGVEGGRRLLACSGYTACVAAATCAITSWTSVATISITLGLQSNGGYPNAGTLITGSMTYSYSGSGASITASSSVSSGSASFHCTNGGYDCCWTWTAGSITCLAGWVCAGAPINPPWVSAAASSPVATRHRNRIATTSSSLRPCDIAARGRELRLADPSVEPSCSTHLAARPRRRRQLLWLDVRQPALHAVRRGLHIFRWRRSHHLQRMRHLRRWLLREQRVRHNIPDCVLALPCWDVVCRRQRRRGLMLQLPAAAKPESAAAKPKPTATAAAAAPATTKTSAAAATKPLAAATKPLTAAATKPFTAAAATKPFTAAAAA